MDAAHGCRVARANAVLNTRQIQMSMGLAGQQVRGNSASTYFRMATAGITEHFVTARRLLVSVVISSFGDTIGREELFYWQGSLLRTSAEVEADEILEN